MNLTRALDVALPEIPARTLAQRFPCMDPNRTFREHIEDGKPVVRVYIPSSGGMYILQTESWKLAQLFDGKRSFQEIAEIYSRESGMQFDEASVREFAGDLDAELFWYKTAQEKNIIHLQQSLEERRKKLKARSKWANLSEITFPAFNPDRFFTWLQPHTEFLYSPWFTSITLLAFASSAAITITHWQQIGHDTLQFYDFTSKTWGDVFVLYTLGMLIVAVHEGAHAHACKHYGGRVPAMGFALIYLTPAFYTDTTEGSVKGTRSQRLIIALSGVWSELVLCAIATPIWWGTPPDTLVHNGAYFIMMFTGIMSVIVNWNPLMKLDGYVMLCEIVGISELKESSTAFVSASVKKYIWRLPVEVPYVPKRRRLGYAVYALLSGAYCYALLYFVARFAGNIVRNFSPEWGFIPELAVAFLIFRSRIRLLVNFMKFVYLDKKDRIRAWFTPRHAAAAAVVAALLLALPLWRESVTGKFILEPLNSVEVRAHVPGTLDRLYVKEGESVVAGTPLAELSNIPLQSDYQNMRAKLLLASDRANAASLHYADYGPAVKEREQLSAQVAQLGEMNSALQLMSPIAGTVLTSKVQDLLGTYLPSGTELLEVADTSSLRARIYISEYNLSKITLGAAARLQLDGQFRRTEGVTSAIAVIPSKLDARLVSADQLKIANAPHFYQVDIVVQNPENRMRPGMLGMARIYGQRRSLAGMIGESVKDFWSRKLW
jgi:putative peptide zinc metalloprotease protein